MSELNSKNNERTNIQPSTRFWMLVGAVSIAFFLLLLTGVLVFLGKRRAVPAQLPAVLEIIPAVTNTPQPVPGTESPANDPGAGEPGQHGVGLAVGVYVQISDTGGDGLRLRNQPGLEGTVLMVAGESEVFKIEDGPVEMDNYKWWYLVGPFDQTRKGWGVDTYLELIQNPS